MDKTGLFFIGLISGVMLMLIAMLTMSITPMDVYQGKTTLKYEVVDGVKVDSIVVWKDNY